jgi:pyruvate dehydrogenase E2 component (dihydrolipoamide acetyltransferase)
MNHRSEKLDYASRWLRDGMQAWRTVPMFFEIIDMDMSRCKEIRMAASEAAKPSYAHMMVRAAARALAANPDLHIIVSGTRKHHPESVDVALSLSGDDFAAPVIIIKSAHTKSLAEISSEVNLRSQEAKQIHERAKEKLRRWGWLAPFGLLRRAAVRLLMADFKRRSAMTGTFHVSMVPTVNVAGTFVFATTGMLSLGRIRDLPVVVDGQIQVRPMITAVCSADHRVWDGMAASRFLWSVKDFIESGDL